jgi:UDP-N-acetylmuramate dehydrogenase
MEKIKLTGKEIIQIIKSTGLRKIVFDADTSKLSSIRAGGRVLCYFNADNIDELKIMIETCSKNGIDFLLVGDCTNILFNGGYMNMVLIRLGRGFNYIKLDGENNLNAGASFNFLNFIVKAASMGFDFSEFSGIPGTLGGSVAGNSGTNKTGICDHISEVRCIVRSGNEIVEKNVSLSKNDYGYRHLDIKGLIAVTGVVLSAGRSDKKDILSRVKKKINEKKLSQPIKAKSSGCFFKNPDGSLMSAGELIDKCGLKGFCYGGARVSMKHANFIENSGNASPEDILVLSRIVKDKVMGKFNKKLEYEVRLAGF